LRSYARSSGKHFASSTIHRTEESSDGIAIERRPFGIDGVAAQPAGGARDPSGQRTQYGLKLRRIDAICLHDCVRQGIAEQTIDRQFVAARAHDRVLLRRS
jgi:hypothetical protein